MKYRITIWYPGDMGIGISRTSDKSVESMLEQLFEEFNNGSGVECEEFTSRKHMRSLSVNDFVSVNGQWYQCKSMGWEAVTNDYKNEIDKEVFDHHLYEQSAYGALQDVMWKRTK